MHFLKKVVTFFSAIWRVFSWGKKVKERPPKSNEASQEALQEFERSAATKEICDTVATFDGNAGLPENVVPYLDEEPIQPILNTDFSVSEAAVERKLDESQYNSIDALADNAEYLTETDRMPNEELDKISQHPLMNCRDDHILHTTNDNLSISDPKETKYNSINEMSSENSGTCNKSSVLGTNAVLGKSVSEVITKIVGVEITSSIVEDSTFLADELYNGEFTTVKHDISNVNSLYSGQCYIADHENNVETEPKTKCKNKNLGESSECHLYEYNNIFVDQIPNVPINSKDSASRSPQKNETHLVRSDSMVNFFYNNGIPDAIERSYSEKKITWDEKEITTQNVENEINKCPEIYQTSVEKSILESIIYPSNEIHELLPCGSNNLKIGQVICDLEAPKLLHCSKNEERYSHDNSSDSSSICDVPLLEIINSGINSVEVLPEKSPLSGICDISNSTEMLDSFSKNEYKRPKDSCVFNNQFQDVEVQEQFVSSNKDSITKSLLPDYSLQSGEKTSDAMNYLQTQLEISKQFEESIEANAAEETTNIIIDRFFSYPGEYFSEDVIADPNQIIESYFPLSDVHISLNEEPFDLPLIQMNKPDGNENTTVSNDEHIAQVIESEEMISGCFNVTEADGEISPELYTITKHDLTNVKCTEHGIRPKYFNPCVGASPTPIRSLGQHDGLSTPVINAKWDEGTCYDGQCDGATISQDFIELATHNSIQNREMVNTTLQAELYPSPFCTSDGLHPTHQTFPQLSTLNSSSDIPFIVPNQTSDIRLSQDATLNGQYWQQFVAPLSQYVQLTPFEGMHEFESQINNLEMDSSNENVILPFSPFQYAQEHDLFAPRESQSDHQFNFCAVCTNTQSTEKIPLVSKAVRPPDNCIFTHSCWKGCEVEGSMESADDKISSSTTSGFIGTLPVYNEHDDVIANGNLLPGSYFPPVKSSSLQEIKNAESISSEIFCESKLSILSRSTGGDLVNSSFSSESTFIEPISVLQFCEANLSNSSVLPAVVVSTYNKTSEDDYLAKEKFMNDVNTALNESVMEQLSQLQYGEDQDDSSRSRQMFDLLESREENGSTVNPSVNNTQLLSNEYTLAHIGAESEFEVHVNKEPSIMHSLSDPTSKLIRSVVDLLIDNILAGINDSRCESVNKLSNYNLTNEVGCSRPESTVSLEKIENELSSHVAQVNPETHHEQLNQHCDGGILNVPTGDKKCNANDLNEQMLGINGEAEKTFNDFCNLDQVEHNPTDSLVGSCKNSVYEANVCMEDRKERGSIEEKQKPQAIVDVTPDMAQPAKSKKNRRRRRKGTIGNVQEDASNQQILIDKCWEDNESLTNNLGGQHLEISDADTVVKRNNKVGDSAAVNTKNDSENNVLKSNYDQQLYDENDEKILNERKEASNYPNRRKRNKRKKPNN